MKSYKSCRNFSVYLVRCTHPAMQELPFASVRSATATNALTVMLLISSCWEKSSNIQIPVQTQKNAMYILTPSESWKKKAHSRDAPMHSQYKMNSPRFKDNGFINTQLTICIFTKPNLHRSYLCSKQHPVSLKRKRGALRFIIACIESSKVQSIIKEVRAKLLMQIASFPNAINTFKHFDIFERCKDR